ncbi:MAG: hypothetical protein JOY64_22270 [Alphaproteobacteria bacterium]|nr:hypothetical protein [Alphaproteobacteria bacterium]
MDRRTFLSSGLLVGAGCLLCRQAAAFSPNGCRLAQGALKRGTEIRVRERYGDEMIDLQTQDMHDLPVNAAVLFYDDSASPNAMAVRDVYSPEHPDGTVLLGTTLIGQVNQLHPDQLHYGYKRYGQVNDNVGFIFAHELAHILQYKKGMDAGGAWQMEPHADFMAGWSYAQSYKRAKQDSETMELQLEEGIYTMFSAGDTQFGNRAHHGEPQFRAAMVRAGFRSANLDVDAAFAEGKKFAGLR